MEIKARLAGLYSNIKTGGTVVSFETQNLNREELDALSEKDLRLKAVVWREKRSLDANAYCWVLMTKISDVLQTSKEEVYEDCLQRYGLYDLDEDGGIITVSIKCNIDISRIPGHWQYIRDNGTFAGYRKLKGTSEYNTAEMSVFIDHIVSEAKEMGIETLPPEDIEKLKRDWDVRGDS